MDKKTKKRISVLRERSQKIQKMIAGARQQQDDPDEVKNLESDLAKVQAELDGLLQR